MAACRLKLLGGFALLTEGGAELALPTRKDRLLLAYLGMTEGSPQDRGRVAGLLWGDRGDAQARDSLRQSLAALRQTFRAADIDPLRAGRDSVSIEPGVIEIDALTFASLVETAPTQAVGQYAGELLDGIDGLTPEYDAWLLPERERLNALAAQALDRLAGDATTSAERLFGVDLGRRMLARDPTREPVARAVMRLLAEGGDRGEALKVYGACRDALQEELGITPDAQTEALYRAILTTRATDSAETTMLVAATTPERLAVAVLPFRDLSADQTLDPLAEVLGEELVTGLGRFRELLVIDRGSAAMVAAQTGDIAEIGRRLAVDLLVQGSLQRQGERIRITVRLVNPQTRAQRWAEAFEHAASDILALPDQMVARIISTLHGRLEHTLLGERPRPNLAAYARLLKGVKHLRSYGADDNAKAIALFDEALALDPNYQLARLYRRFADVVVHGYGAAPAHVLDAALAAGIQATEQVDDDGRCHLLLGMLHGMRGEVEREADRYRRAIELNPNDANAIAVSGLPLASLGRTDEAIEQFRLAMRLNPHHPEWYWEDLGSILYLAGRYADAIESFRRVSRLSLFSLPRLASALAQLGRSAEAETATAEVLARKPDFSISDLRFGAWSPEQAEHLCEGMRKAGLPG